MNKVFAPFAADQVAALNLYQASGIFHPFTCDNGKCREDLVATEAGWACPKEGCSYTQDWAWDFMCDRTAIEYRTALLKEWIR